MRDIKRSKNIGRKCKEMVFYKSGDLFLARRSEDVSVAQLHYSQKKLMIKY